jgi:transcriptional regulator of arginine metabolism
MTAKRGKEERQEVITRILGSETVDNQEVLLQRLAEEGFELTQATLSRDFREMKIAKTPDNAGNYGYRLPTVQLPQARKERYGLMASFVRHGLLNIDFSGQMAVIKVPAGYAKGIASDIDASSIHGVMGTIAGHDTVLMILREHAEKNQIMQSLMLLFKQS